MKVTDELYQQVILEHNRKPKHFKKLEHPTHTIEGFNPLCGDRYTIELEVSKDNSIKDIGIQGAGCAISKASASMMATQLIGAHVEDAKILFGAFHQLLKGEETDEIKALLGKLNIFQGISKFPSRIKCASLSWHALVGALEGKDTTTTE